MNISQNLPRLLLFAAIGGLILILLKQWVGFSSDYEKKLAESQYQNNEPSLLLDPMADLQDAESLNTTGDENMPSEISIVKNHEPPAISNKAYTSARNITVETDTLKVTIDSLGGDIIEVALLKHLARQEAGSEPLLLLEKSRQRIYTAQSGLIGPSGTEVKSAFARFTSSASEYKMQGKNDLIVDLYFNDASGVYLTKRYTFKHNDYLIDVDYIVDNQSSGQWTSTYYSQISRDDSADPGADSGGFGMQSYLGAATSTSDDPYKKISFKDIKNKKTRFEHTGGWVAMIQHYFVSAWVPNQEENFNFYTKETKSGLNVIGFLTSFVVEKNQTETIGAQFYAGPKYQYRLKEIAPNLDLTVDYGWLWWIAQPLYTLLYFFATGEAHVFGEVYNVFSGFGNWGAAIIMLTVVIKALFFKLSASSYRSMANMRRVQPKLLDLRERHADDKQAQSKAMMELYQKEKINPLGGCLPILVQMPVFIALYWALMESVELRHAPFIGWITDLSVMDPYFVLPLIMGITMFLQQKMNPPPPDPMQAKIMQWMPVVFTFFFVFFPAGLVVYWVSNNILSITQQWYITRQIEQAA
tara:strand:- start:1038 stop:2789 length:1752 start_codon:yes stop_codon:yes gene_type:complete